MGYFDIPVLAGEQSMKSIIVIASKTKSLINFRGALIKNIKAHGVKVTTLSNKPTNEQVNELSNLGAKSQHVSFSRGKLSVISDLKVLFELISKYREIRPDIVLAYTIKPIIWGGLAARFFKINFYGLITGLGYSFQGKSFKRRILTKLVVFLYKLALKNSKAVIFQNEDNRDVFVSKGIVKVSKTHVVNGSGVDLKKYDIEEFPDANIKFLCISRLLGEKGLREYAEAAKIVKNKFPNVEFDLVGSVDSSPDAISLSEVCGWSDYVCYRGYADDIRPYIKNSHVYVLPSYHEGLPRSTLEAMSMGRPIITTNASGCKDTVIEGVNGFKIEVGSIENLVNKMMWFVNHKDRIEPMGRASREFVEKKFDVHEVNRNMIELMDLST